VKFLVIARPRQGQQGMTSAMVQKTREMLKADIKSGRVDFIYHFAGGNGVAGIYNVDSGDALDEALQRYPTTPFVDHETYPLADGDKFFANLIEGLKRQGL